MDGDGTGSVTTALVSVQIHWFTNQAVSVPSSRRFRIDFGAWSDGATGITKKSPENGCDKMPIGLYFLRRGHVATKVSLVEAKKSPGGGKGLIQPSWRGWISSRVGLRNDKTNISCRGKVCGVIQGYQRILQNSRPNMQKCSTRGQASHVACSSGKDSASGGQNSESVRVRACDYGFALFIKVDDLSPHIVR
jgi:hypothetical protein